MEKEEENINKQPVSHEPPAQAPAPERKLVESSKPEKPFKTAGTRIHNEITYRVIDWLVNSAVGVGFTYWAKRTPSGKKYFGEPVTNFFKAIIKPLTKDPHTLEEGAKWGSMFASIMAGGTAIIPVMMVSENKKVKKTVVKCLDEKIYGEERVKNDPQFAECYQQIDEEPRKSFTTGMLARIVAIAPLITAASTPAINNKLIKYLYDPIAKLTKGGAKMLGIQPAKMMSEGVVELVEGTKQTAFSSNWEFLHRTIGFDFGLTIFYAYLHEKAYKAFSAFADKKKHPHEQKTEPHAVVQAPAAPESEPEKMAPAKEYQVTHKVKPQPASSHTERYRAALEQNASNQHAHV